MPRETRQDKAVRLLSTERVRLTALGPESCRAEVRGDTADYTVSLNGRWRCDCAAVGECSHIIAARMVYRAVRPALT